MYKVSGMSEKIYDYSEESKELVKKAHHQVLAELIEEHGLENDREYVKFSGYRLDEERSLRVLGCNISEEVFLTNPNEVMKQVLMYSASAQYYYDNEKEW